MADILDAGALIDIENNDRVAWIRLKSQVELGLLPRTHGGVVGQVWRGRGTRQARLATALRLIDVLPLDRTLGQASGVLLAAAGSSDVVDAALVALAQAGDRIVTSDPDDIASLIQARGTGGIDVLAL